MTFKEIQDDALENAGYLTTGTGSPRARFKRLINQANRELLADPKNDKTRNGQFTFTTVASTPLVGIPMALQRIDDIFDPNGENPRLIHRTLDWMRMDNRADQNTGTPGVYVPHGLKPIYRYPVNTGSGLWVASSSASDTTQTVTVQAFRVDGFQHNPTAVTLTGITRVAVGSRTDYVDVMRIRLSAVCVGDVTLYDAASGGNVLAVIPIGRTTQVFTVIQLYPCPADAYTYTVEGQRAMMDLVEDLDEPPFAQDFHHILSLKTIERELRVVKKQISQANEIVKFQIVPLENLMAAYPLLGPDYVVVPDDGRTRTALLGSNLGSWFPKGRW